jgi:hypothetical protein
MIGTNLQNIIAEKYGKIGCGPCAKRVERLNQMEPSEVMAQIDDIASMIYGSRKKIKSKLMRIMSETLPREMVIGIIKTHIKQAIEEHLNG